jgi:site-specific recombinase XerD
VIDPIAVAHINASPFYEVTGLPPQLKKETRSFFEIYLARGFSRRTIRAYAFDLVVFFRFYRGKKKKIPAFANVDFKILIEFIHQERGRNAAPTSINRRLNTIDILYRHCFNKMIPGTSSIVEDPTRFRSKRYLTMDAKLGIFPVHAKPGRTFRVRIPHRMVKALEPHEVSSFFETLHTNRDRAIVALMLVCGLRCMEVLGINLSDLNMLSQNLKVRGKGNKERIVPLPEGVLKIVEKYMETERPVRAKEDALFLVQKGPRRGMRMSLEGLRGVFRYHRAVSGIRHANAHRFRHTFGRNMAAAGMSLPALQKLLGHADHRTTLKYINLTLQDVYADFEKAQAQIKDLYGESIQ